MSEDKLFPFNTCETPNTEGIAQPYSTFVNVVNCFIILYFLLKTKQTQSFLLLFSIFSFQTFHSFSHMIHIQGPAQTNIIHTLSYLINLAFFNVFYSYSNKLPDYRFVFLLFVLICYDLYALMKLPVFYFILSQSLIAIALFVYYYNFLPKTIQNSIYKIIIIIVLIEERILLILFVKFQLYLIIFHH